MPFRQRVHRLLCHLLFGVMLLAPAIARAQIAPLSVPQLPDVIPLFPLPNVAVLPYLQVPLRVFEPRYREMLADVMAGDHVIGIVQLQPGFEREYEGRPPVFSIGCAALVVTAERQATGEFEIVLRGFTKFRITGETADKSYRLAQVEPIPEPIDEQMRSALRDQRPALEEAIASSLGVTRDSLRLPPMSDEDLVNSIVMNFDFDTVDRQVLIEQDGVLARARKLEEMLRKVPAALPAPRR